MEEEYIIKSVELKTDKDGEDYVVYNQRKKLLNKFAEPPSGYQLVEDEINIRFSNKKIFIDCKFEKKKPKQEVVRTYNLLDKKP